MNAFLTKEMGQFIEVHDRAHSMMLQSASALVYAAGIDKDDDLECAVREYIAVMNSQYISVLKASKVTVEQFFMIRSPKKEFPMTSSEKLAQAFGETGI